MSKAQICPVCIGKGKIRENESNYHTSPEIYKRCHGCGGTGWVTVSN